MRMKKVLITFVALIFTLSLADVSNAQKKKVRTAKKPVVSQTGNLTIEVGLIFTSGDVKPVARAEFYLLDENAEKSLKETYGESTDLKSITLALNFPSFETNGVQKALTAIAPHIVSFVTTDFQGKAKFSSVKVGNYYLFGFSKTGNGAVVWNLNTTIKSGTNSIILDNKNAALISNKSN